MGAHSQTSREIPSFGWGSRVAAFCTTGLMVVGLIAFLGLGVGPRTGAYKTTTMLSGSMSPGIPIGSVLLTVPKPITEIHQGSVVTFQAPVADRHVVTHRVTAVAIKNGILEVHTKGDANALPDPWVAQLGNGKVWVVTAVIPWAGTVVQKLRNPTVHRLTVVVLPALALVFGLTRIWRRNEALPA